MINISKLIITNILTALYQPFWNAVLLAFLVMFVWKNYTSPIAAIKQWIHWFKTDVKFRKMFIMVFYIAMILLRTLLNRNMWNNPVSNVMGNWWIYKSDGSLTTECFENLALFIPFTILLLWIFREKIIGEKLCLLNNPG